jgi:hypothetical protein
MTSKTVVYAVCVISFPDWLCWGELITLNAMFACDVGKTWGLAIILILLYD